VGDAYIYTDEGEAPPKRVNDGKKVPNDIKLLNGIDLLNGINLLSTTSTARGAKPQQKRMQRMRVRTNTWHPLSHTHSLFLSLRPRCSCLFYVNHVMFYQ